MAKTNRKDKTIIKKKPVNSKANFHLSERVQDSIFLSLITIMLIVLMKPMVLDGLTPQGVDIIAAKGKSNQVAEYKEKTGEEALWNPAIFSGMPRYYDMSPVAFSVDTILSWFSRFSGKAFIYYLFAAFGMYFLLRYMKMPPIIAFVGSVIFVLIPHYKSLWIEGHFRKFRAIMYIPWIFLAFQYFLNKKNILAAALFAIAFGIQIRTQHYQIIFYTGLLIFSVGIYPFLKLLTERQFAVFTRATLLLLVSLTLALLMAAQPLFLAREYLPYSKRGKTTIDLEQRNVTENSKDGVTLEYATQWSTHPSEVFTWIIPRFAGGMSNERYSGDSYPSLRGQEIPGYWGHMPFTQSYEYMGVLTLLLAVIGIYAFRKSHLVISLSIYGFFLILLSFGRHFDSFYGLFYNYLPYFNKFRAPMMSVTVTFFIITLLAAYGLEFLRMQTGDDSVFKRYRNIIYILGGFLILGILLYLAGMSFSFTKPGGERYAQQYIDMFRKIRQEMYNADIVRYFILVILSGAGIYAYLSKRINFLVLGIVFAVVTLVDLISLGSHVQKKFIDMGQLEKRYFKQTDTDIFLNSDLSLFRILPAGKQFSDNRWGYYHETIGGYSPIKMYVIEELIENSLYKGWESALPINWNVLKMLNVKYVIAQGQVEHPALQLVNTDVQNGFYTYLFSDFLPRFYIVGKTEQIPNEYDRLARVNKQEFNPTTTAIIEEELGSAVSAPDSSFTRVLDYTPNRILLEAYTDKKALLVMSIPYYPPGWKIKIDDSLVEKIYKTNHALQSVIMPEGMHRVEVTFHPDSFYDTVHMAYASVTALYVAIAVSLFMNFRIRRS